MKKKILASILLSAIALFMIACGYSESSSESSDLRNDSSSELTESSAPERNDNISEQPESSASELTDNQSQEQKEASCEITYISAKAYTNSIGTPYVQVIVEIENTGTTDLYLSSGSYDLEDADGNLLASNSMVSTYPTVISPGEKAYMYDEDMMDEPVSGEIVVKPRPNVKIAQVENIRYNISDVNISTDKYGRLKAIGRIENGTNENADGMIYIVFILKDAGGNPIGQIFTILMDDLAAGDKIGFEATETMLPNDVTAESVASYEVFAYPMQIQF